MKIKAQVVAGATLMGSAIVFLIVRGGDVDFILHILPPWLLTEPYLTWAAIVAAVVGSYLLGRVAWRTATALENARESNRKAWDAVELATADREARHKALEDMKERLDRLERTNESLRTSTSATVDHFRREFDSKIDALRNEFNDTLEQTRSVIQDVNNNSADVRQELNELKDSLLELGVIRQPPTQP